MNDFSLENLLIQAAKSAALDQVQEFDKYDPADLTREQAILIVRALKQGISEQYAACRRLADCAEQLHRLVEKCS